MFLAVILQNEFFVQATHPLLVQEVRQLGTASSIALKQPLHHQVANGDQHAVGLVITVILNPPIDIIDIQRLHIPEEYQQLPQFFFPGPADVGADQQFHRGFQDPVHIAVDRKIIIGTYQLLPQY